VKKTLSILTVLLTIASMLNFSVARHYCRGVEVASRFSLSGELASCGMEETENGCPLHGQMLDNHCCDDSVIMYGIDNTCINSPYSFPEESRTNHLPLLPAQATAVNSMLLLTGSYFTDTGPPLSRDPATVHLTSICLFRL